MRKLHLLAGALLTAAPLALSPTSAVQPDACGAEALPVDPSCGDAALCSARERVKVACEVREALEKRYVFFEVKSKLLAPAASGAPFDSRAHLDACVEAERSIAREDDPSRFYDRMRRCAGAFEDGHLILGAPARLPEVALGVGLRLVEGRVLVANFDRRLVTAAGGEDGAPALAVGEEVVLVDGRPVAEVLEELAAHVPGSSRAARLERAVDALTRRDFAFPARRTAALTVAAGEARRVVELPWWISPGAEDHVATRAWVRRNGVPTTDLLPWRDGPRSEAARAPGAVEGQLRGAPILPARDAEALREYRDDQDRPAVRLGEVVRRRDRAFCYLQVLTFHTESLAGREGRRGFTAVVDGFLRECSDKDLDLVLDLRQNEGGYISHSSALAAALSAPGRSVPGGALLLRANETNQLVYKTRAPAPGAATAPGAPLDPARIADAIGVAMRENREFSPAFLEPPVQAASASGYRGRVVALVSPSCMSACDRLSEMLREGGRAVLVGAPTEGAGGSQQEATNLGTRFTDSGGFLTLSIPNAAMGVQRAGGEPRREEAPAEEFFRAFALENRPVEPDVAYATRAEDLTFENRGWLEQVERVLFAPPAAGAAGR